MGEVIGIGEYATRIMKEEGIECGFGVVGFHSEMLYTMFPQYGMPLYCGRHEQWGPYAADGYAGASRKMAICFGTAGPGVTNMVSGIAQAYQNYRPMIAFCGMHGPAVDKHWTIQEAYPVEIMKSCCKFAYEIKSADIVGYWIRRACKVAREYPPGPVVLACSPQILGWTKDVDEYIFTHPRSKVAYPTPSAGYGPDVEKAVEMILNAKHPIIYGGDGIFCAHAEQELREFVELTQTPFCGRRMSRGAVPENHPLAVPPRSRGDVQAGCDLQIFIGMKDNMMDMHFQPPPVGFFLPGIPTLQINEVQADLIDFLPTPLAILGNPKFVLQQMIEYAKEMLKVKKPDRTEVLKALADSRAKVQADWETRAKEEWDKPPIKGYAWKKVIREFVRDYPETTIVLDSFTGSYWASDGYECMFAGQSQDAGGWGGVGHGIAMGFGIQEAKPGKPVLVIMGDGGMGVGGWEIETCARYKKPVVTIIWNNSEWMGPLHDWLYKSMGPDNRLQQDIKYDQMFSLLENVHGELCTKPADLRPALERSLNSGKTAVINAITDPYSHNPAISGVPLAYRRWFGVERWKQVVPEEYRSLMSDEQWEEFATYSQEASRYLGL